MVINMNKKISAFLSLILIFSLAAQASAADSGQINAAVKETAEYVYRTTADPQVGTVGGEWAVLGLARSGEEIPGEYFQRYCDNAEKYVTARGGVLHEKKYTEYSRMILALTAIGKNPADVGGYNLLTPLGDYESTLRQGINGAIWALIALDSGNYEMPRCDTAPVQASREMYINYILENRTADGGWALSGGISDPDTTAMALQALAKYRDSEAVKNAVEAALICMSEKQNESGGFSSYDTENSESCAQMITALCELGIPLDDSRFVKNGNTMLDNLMTYRTEGGGFKHTADEENPNQMAAEQCLYSLAAVKRALEGKSSLYSMSDAVTVSDIRTDGLAGKNPDVRRSSVIYPGKTFSDIIGHENQSAAEALAQRNIISGRTEDSFEPDGTMTRAEFSAIIVRGLGLCEKSGAVFTDVEPDDWFYSFVNTAYSYGIVNGVSDSEFNPDGTITREEAAVMSARAAGLCGMDTELNAFEARDILAVFFDYVQVSEWAAGALAFCYDNGILSGETDEIKPKEAVTRAEIAQLLFNMLSHSMLI